MSSKVIPIDLFNNTSVTYDQTKTSLIGKITTKNISGKNVVGAPIVKYRNTFTSSETITPVETVITDNNRIFIIQAESVGLATIAVYSLDTNNGEPTYIGKINIQLPEPPTTTYTYRGFRVVDDGVSNWKIFLLVTANVAAHAGLYVVDNIGLSDFVAVPPTIPTATLPGQKAVYRYDLTGPINIIDGAGISVDKTNTTVYVHRGVSASHSFSLFNYSTAVVTVGALGQTDNTFVHSTGNLPVLSGILLLTNSEEYVIPSTGPNSGHGSIFFCTSTNMYRGRVSDLTSGAVTWPTLEIANNQAPINTEAGSVTTVRATFSQSLNRAILLLGSSSYSSAIAIKEFTDSQRDLLCNIDGVENAENNLSGMFGLKLATLPVGMDAKQGFISIISNTIGQRGLYTLNIDSEDLYDQTHIISPVIDVSNKIITNFTAGFVRPDLASPIKVYYRTSGFGTASGGWIAVNDDLDFGSLASPTGQIQIKIGFKLFQNNLANGIQLYSCGIIAIDADAISDNWEYSHDDSSPGNPSIAAFRLKKAYTSTVPDLTFRATDLSNVLYVQSTTGVNPSLFEYSTDNGVNWLPLGTIPNTVGTLLRYTFAVPPGVDVRPSLKET